MAALVACVAAVFAALGIYLAEIGGVSVFRGDWAGATLSLAIAGLVGYGTYLFARAASRVHRESRRMSADGKQRGRRAIRGMAAFALAEAVFSLGLPGVV